jgi:hypothetical protein
MQDTYRWQQQSGPGRRKGYPQGKSGNCNLTSRFWTRSKTRNKWMSITECREWWCQRWRQEEASTRWGVIPAWRWWRRTFYTLSSRFPHHLFLSLLPFPLPSFIKPPAQTCSTLQPATTILKMQVQGALQFRATCKSPYCEAKFNARVLRRGDGGTRTEGWLLLIFNLQLAEISSSVAFWTTIGVIKQKPRSSMPRRDKKMA